MREHQKRVLRKICGRTVVPMAILMLVGVGSADARIGLYVSPGLRVGFDSRGCTSLSGKISLGVNLDADLDAATHFTYLNFTLGFRAPVSNRARALYDECNFFQVQFGMAPKRDLLAFAGGGVGVMWYYKNGNPDRALLATLSLGSLLFLESDLLIADRRLLLVDTGFLAVLPLSVHGYKKWSGLR